MKSFGKFLLLFFVHIITSTICLLMCAFIVNFLIKAKIGKIFLYQLTGGDVDIAIMIFCCILSFIACNAVADKINGYKQIIVLGFILVVLNIIFMIINIIHKDPFAPNIVKIIYWSIFIKEANKENKNEGR